MKFFFLFSPKKKAPQNLPEVPPSTLLGKIPRGFLQKPCLEKMRLYITELAALSGQFVVEIHRSMPRQYLEKIVNYYTVVLVAQCSATPASVAATPPCSATPFQRQLGVRHSWQFQGDRCDRAF